MKKIRTLKHCFIGHLIPNTNMPFQILLWRPPHSGTHIRQQSGSHTLQDSNRIIFLIKKRISNSLHTGYVQNKISFKTLQLNSFFTFSLLELNLSNHSYKISKLITQMIGISYLCVTSSPINVPPFFQMNHCLIAQYQKWMPVKKDPVRITEYALEKQVEGIPVCVLTIGKVKTAL